MQAIVVDDSRAMRIFLCRQLEAMGFEALQAFDGVDALQLLRGLSSPPGLALIDWNMPNINGLELVIQIRKESNWRDITLMMVTTESEYSNIVRALAAGAHEYLIKPFTADALAEKLGMLGLISREVEV